MREPVRVELRVVRNVVPIRQGRFETHEVSPWRTLGKASKDPHETMSYVEGLRSASDSSSRSGCLMGQCAVVFRVREELACLHLSQTNDMSLAWSKSRDRRRRTPQAEVDAEPVM